MGFEHRTLHDLTACSNLWATGDYGEKGWNVSLWGRWYYLVTKPNDDLHIWTH